MWNRMITLVNKTFLEFREAAKNATSLELTQINQIKKAIESKKPDDILFPLQKSGELSQYFGYWQSRSCQDPNEIKSTIKDNDKSIIHILIDVHILKLISGEPSKIIWRDPNIVNPQGKLSVQKKQPDWNSQSKIAIILGVSRQAVQKLCKNKFKSALNEKGKINLWHPIVQLHKEEMEAKRQSTAGPVPKPKPTTKESSSTSKTNKPEFRDEIKFEDIEDLTLKEIVQNYGSIVGFKNYLDSMTKMVEWKLKEQKYRHSRNELIEKIPVASSLFSIVNIMLSRIVNEYPATVTDQLFAIAKGEKDTSRIDAIELQQKTLSKIIKDAKKELVRDLKKI